MALSVIEKMGGLDILINAAGKLRFFNIYKELIIFALLFINILLTKPTHSSLSI